MNKFAKKISLNLKQLKVEPDSAWLVQTKQELADHMSSVKIKIKREPKFNHCAETLRLLMQPMPVALASFGLTLIIGSAAISNAQSTLPGDALYPLKRASEQIVLSLTGDLQLQSGLKINFENRRLAELLQLSKKPEPVNTSNYEINSGFVVSHINNTYLQQKLASLDSVLSAKSNQLASKNVNDIENNEPISKTNPPVNNPSKLALAPIIANANNEIENDPDKQAENKEENLLIDNSLDTNNQPPQTPTNDTSDNNKPSAIMEQQPQYANLGSGGGSAPVNTPASRPTAVEPNASESATEKISSDTLANNTGPQHLEPSFETDGSLAMPTNESPVLSDNLANTTPAPKAITPTSTESLVENIETRETTEVNGSQPTSNESDPAQDQPTQDPPTGDSSGVPNGDEEPNMPDASNEANENTGKIINIVRTLP